MATTTEQGIPDRASPSSDTAAGALEPRRTRGVVWWASFGVLALGVQAWTYGTWIASGDATPQSTGADDVPTITRIWAVSHQVVAIVGLVVALVWIVRKCRRERRLTFAALFTLGWMSVWWLDPVVNFARTVFFYNSAFVNLSSWTEHVPGWISPNGGHLPEPILFTGLLYVWFLPALAAVGALAMRLARRRWPRLSVPATIAVGYVSLLVLELAFEVVWIRLELFAYPGTVHAVSIWGGERWQFPVYESIFWGGMLTAMASLLFFRDDRGRSVVERGIDRVRVTGATRTLLRVLAVIGFANVMYVAVYLVPINTVNLYVDRTPDGYPTYLRNDVCGEGTQYACPDPELPLPLPDSEPVPPPAETGTS